MELAEGCSVAQLSPFTNNIALAKLLIIIIVIANHKEEKNEKELYSTTTYTYFKNGTVKTEVIKNVSDGSVVTRKYNKHGDLVKSTSQGKSSLSVKKYNNRKYDKKGNCVRESYSWNYNDNGDTESESATIIYKYTYDKNKNIKKCVCTTTYNNGSTYTTTTTYKYKKVKVPKKFQHFFYK